MGSVGAVKGMQRGEGMGRERGREGEALGGARKYDGCERRAWRGYRSGYEVRVELFLEF